MQEKRIIIICLLALLVAVLYVIQPFVTPMLLAAIIVLFFFPVYGKIHGYLTKSPRLSSFLTTFFVLMVIILPSAWVVGTLIDQVYGLVGEFDLKATFSRVFSAQFYLVHIEPWIKGLEDRFQMKIDLLGVLTSFGKEAAKQIYNYSPSVMMGTANFLFQFVIMLFGIYFLFLEGPDLLKILFDIIPLKENHEWQLAKKVSDTIHASIYGYILTGLVQGFVAAAVFLSVGLKAFVVLGVLTFFMSMVPLVGATGVWLPVCIWLFSQGQTWQGVVVMIFGAGVISLIDNFLKPIIIQGKTNIHPLLIFFSIFGGIKLFGPLGILFGPVIFALLIAIIHIYREEYA